MVNVRFDATTNAAARSKRGSSPPAPAKKCEGGEREREYAAGRLLSGRAAERQWVQRSGHDDVALLGRRVAVAVRRLDRDRVRALDERRIGDQGERRLHPGRHE